MYAATNARPSWPAVCTPFTSRPRPCESVRVKRAVMVPSVAIVALLILTMTPVVTNGKTLVVANGLKLLFWITGRSAADAVIKNAAITRTNIALVSKRCFMDSITPVWLVLTGVGKEHAGYHQGVELLQCFRAC